MPLDLTDSVDSLVAAVRAAHYRAEFKESERLARELIALSVSRDDPRGEAWGHSGLGTARLLQGDVAEGEAEYNRALEMFQAIGDRDGVALVQANLGSMLLEYRLDVAEARRNLDEAVAALRISDNERSLAYALANRGKVCRMEGDYEQAMRLADESYELFMQAGIPVHAGWQLVNKAHYHSLRREYPEAISTLRKAFDHLSPVQGELGRASYFEVAFVIATEIDAWDVAARLRGFLECYDADCKVLSPVGILPWFLPRVEMLTRRMPEAALNALHEEGAALSLDQAQALIVNLAPKTPV